MELVPTDELRVGDMIVVELDGAKKNIYKISRRRAGDPIVKLKMSETALKGKHYKRVTESEVRMWEAAGMAHFTWARADDGSL